MLNDISELDTSKYAISTGCVRYRDLSYLVIVDRALANERVPHSTILGIDRGHIGGADLFWSVASIAACHAPLEQAIAIGAGGQVYVLGGGTAGEEAPVVGDSGPSALRGPLREVRGIAHGHAYAVGTARQCYRRAGPGLWTCIDASAQSADGRPLIDKSFESIDGFSEEEIYTVGWDGEIWSWNGSQWRQEGSPTNLGLQKVICAPDGNVYVAGKLGTIITGRGSDWQLIEHDQTDETFWGMAWLDDHLYLSTTHFVYRLENRALIPCRPAEDRMLSCYHLSAADGVMWSIGFEEVFEVTGGNWRRLL